MLDLDRMRFCTNPVCSREIPAVLRDGAPCPHCGRETAAPGLDGGSLLPFPPREAPPFWQDVGPVAWATAGWVLFLTWLYGAYWGHFRYPEAFPSSRLVAFGAPVALWWLADLSIHRPRRLVVALGACLVAYGLCPLPYCGYALLVAWVGYWTRFRGD
jgi:hypothetical protein